MSRGPLKIVLWTAITGGFFFSCAYTPTPPLMMGIVDSDVMREKMTINYHDRSGMMISLSPRFDSLGNYMFDVEMADTVMLVGIALDPSFYMAVLEKGKTLEADIIDSLGHATLFFSGDNAGVSVFLSSLSSRYDYFRGSSKELLDIYRRDSLSADTIQNSRVRAIALMQLNKFYSKREAYLRLKE